MFSGQETTGNIDFRLCDQLHQSESSYLRNEEQAMNTRNESELNVTNLSVSPGSGPQCKSNEQLRKDLEKLQKERQSLEEQSDILKARLAENRRETSGCQTYMRTRYSYL